LSKKIEELPLILDAHDIAEIMGFSLRTAYLIMDFPNFPTIRIGKTKRVGRDEFFTWLKQQTVSKMQ